MDVEVFKIYFIDKYLIECIITHPANSIVLPAHLEESVVMHFVFNNLDIEYKGSEVKFTPIRVWQVRNIAHLEWVQLKWG